MAENEQAVDIGTQEQAPIVEPVEQQTENVVAEEGQQTAPAAPAEKMVPSSHVSKIAAREARAAAEKERQRVTAEFEQKISQMQQGQQGQQQPPANVGGIAQIPPEQLKEAIHAAAWEMSRTNHANQVEQNWLSAMNAEMQEDPDFVDLYDALGIEQHPELVLGISGMDNKAAVVKDLAKNPSKYANILMLAKSGSMKLAQSELNKLSASIKVNEDAKKIPKVDAPLSQIKPSNIGSDNGEMSVSDFKAQSWLRG